MEAMSSSTRLGLRSGMLPSRATRWLFASATSPPSAPCARKPAISAGLLRRVLEDRPIPRRARRHHGGRPHVATERASVLVCCVDTRRARAIRRPGRMHRRRDAEDQDPGRHRARSSFMAPYFNHFSALGEDELNTELLHNFSLLYIISAPAENLARRPSWTRIPAWQSIQVGSLHAEYGARDGGDSGDAAGRPCESWGPSPHSAATGLTQATARLIPHRT